MTLHRWKRRGAALALLLASSCGFMDAPGTPHIMAHRFGSGHYPENSRSALSAALREGYPGIETDLVLTKDRVPVLSHNPWVNPALCTYTPVEGETQPRRLSADTRILIKDLTLDELQRDYRCGGIEDPAKPGATLVVDTYLTFDEMLSMLKGHPDVKVQLDIKQTPQYTESPEVFADEILGRWNAAALPNPMLITATRGELLKAFQARQDLEALLIWPTFTADQSSTVTAITNELTRNIGAQELIQLTRDAGADGIAVSYAVADRAALEAVRQAGLEIGVWAPDTETQLAGFCRWPLDYLITDYVERVPCR